MATTQQPLAVRPQAPAAFGSRDEIQAIADRIRVMLPSANLADWQLKRNDSDALQKKLNESIYRAAQLSVFYRLVPGEDVHVIPFGNDWAVDMGIETWKKSADRYCSLHGITYHIVTEEMSVEELKERRGKEYHAEDCGMVAYLWRSDKRDVYEVFGAKQSMSRATGIWRKQATRKKDGQWLADTVPAHRTKHDVAKRRAMKAVLKLEFSLDSLLAATPAEVRGSIDVMNSRLDSEERQRAPMLDRRVEFEDDDCCFEKSDANPRRGMQFVVVDEDGVIEQEPDMDKDEEDGASAPDVAEDAADYTSLANALTGTQASFVQWARQTHNNSNGECSEVQYRYLAGVLNKITGDSDSHRLLLGIMLRRRVSSNNRPGYDLVGKLLQWLVAEHNDADTGEKIANPAYRQDYVECVKGIYESANGVAA